MGTRLKIISFKKMYEEDMKSGKGFPITEAEGLVNKKRNENGIYSQKYGVLWQDKDSESERYSCECKKTTGGFYEGTICEYCGTRVKFVDNDLYKTGWLVIENKFKLIHPILYKMIESIIGAKHLTEILDFEGQMNKRGKLRKRKIDKVDPDIKKYYGIGLTEFKNRFDEILDFFYKKKKTNKKDTYKLIQKNRNKIFIKHIPVFSLLLRPILVLEEDFKFGDVNRVYMRLVNKILTINNNELISDKKPIKIEAALSLAQKLFMDIYMYIIDALSRKEGHIRSNIMGGRYNFSSRAVITPLFNKKMNSVELPYLVMLELYKPEIVNLLIKMDKITVNEALIKWNKAVIRFNKKIYEIMKYLIKNTKGGLHVIINRNPTINYGSVLLMKVKGVKSNYSDLTLSIPINVLVVLGADFDGDVLNILAVRGKKKINQLKLFDPRSNMLISRNNGKLNEAFNLHKDQIISLNKFFSLK